MRRKNPMSSDSNHQIGLDGDSMAVGAATQLALWSRHPCSSVVQETQEPVRSAARSLALAARGLAAISASLGRMGLLVSMRTRPALRLGAQEVLHQAVLERVEG